jgi:hypothetical protein
LALSSTVSKPKWVDFMKNAKILTWRLIYDSKMRKITEFTTF